MRLHIHHLERVKEHYKNLNKTNDSASLLYDVRSEDIVHATLASKTWIYKIALLLT